MCGHNFLSRKQMKTRPEIYSGKLYELKTRPIKTLSCIFHCPSEFQFPSFLCTNKTKVINFMVVLSFQTVQFTTPNHLSLCKPSVSGCSVRCGIAEPSGEPAPMGQKTKYNDGFFERGFMTLFARKMMKFAAPAKPRTETKEKAWWEYDYESFVDVSKRVMQGRSRSQQQQVVREVLLSMLPPGAPEQVN